jgi:hypothetical protein
MYKKMLKFIIISASIVFFDDVVATRKCGENRFGLDIFQTFEDFSPKFARRFDISVAEPIPVARSPAHSDFISSCKSFDLRTFSLHSHFNSAARTSTESTAMELRLQ